MSYPSPFPSQPNLSNVKKLLSIAAVASLAPAALAGDVDFITQLNPSYRGGIGADYVKFDVLTTPFGPNSADLGTCGDVTLSNLDPAAFITSTGNIYSFATPISLLLEGASDAPLTEVRMQVRTLGSLPDTGSFQMDFVLLDGTPTTLAPDEINVLGAPGELEIVWAISGALSSFGVTDYEISFQASAPSMSLDVLILDTLTTRDAFESDVDSLSTGFGGVQTLSQDGGSNRAGYPFLVVGSASGTTPGIFYDGLPIPLNYDNYTTETLINPNGGALGNSLGTLDACGRAETTVTVPAGTDPSLAGVQVNHCTLIFNPTALLLDYVGDPVSVDLTL